MRAPRADPLTATSSAITCSSGSSLEPLELERPVEHVLGERAQKADLGAAEACGGAELLGIVGEHLLGRGRAAAEAVGQAA